ncbi:hypothetical protein IWQ60_005415, partial [Tieghemiomyces parasiticus]
MPLLVPGLSSNDSPKAEFYEEVVAQAAALLQDERNWVTNLANVSALLYHSFHESPDPKHKAVNWVGFYLANDKSGAETLTLGPFQGKIACNSIDFNRGVCGAAATQKSAQLVPNVHAFDGHITCDPNSQSELAIPLISKDGTSKLLGVLDVDCAEKE